MEVTLPAKDAPAEPTVEPLWPGRPARESALWPALLVSLLYFCFTLPFLSWTPVTGGMEGNVIIAAQETVRDGHWLPSTQNGAPRLRKPPLAHWTTAAGMLLAPGRSLETATRWPTLATASLMAGLIVLLGNLLFDRQTGVAAGLVAGTCLIFLIYAREASYDMQVAFWTTAADVCLAAALFRRRKWALVGAGVALGLAVMTKGPVALLQSAVPAAAYAVVRRWRNWDDGSGVGASLESDTPPNNRAGWFAAGAVAAAAFVAVALPWPILIARRYPGMIDFWFGQVTLRGERVRSGTGGGNWLAYVGTLWLLWPWLVWIILGAAAAIRGRTPQARRALAMVLWVLLPVAVMTLFPARRSRYVIPLIAPAAVLGAYGLRLFAADVGRMGRAVRSVHWIGLVVPVVAGAAAGALGLSAFRAVDGGRSISPWVAGAGAAAALVLVFVASRRRPGPGPVLAATVLCMAVAYPMALAAYARTPSGTFEAAPFVARMIAAHPDAVYYSARPRFRDPPLVMVIYADRVMWNVPDISAVTPADREQVVVRLETANTPPAPPPFESLGREMIGSELWAAYLLPATPGAPPPVVPPPPGPERERRLWR